MRTLLVLALAIGLLVPVARAQKPPAPPPPPRANPPPTAPGAAGPIGPSSRDVEPMEDRVMFLRGSVVTDDGTPLPSNVIVERFCSLGVKQQIYTTPRGDFSMELGTRADAILDASAGSVQELQGRSANDVRQAWQSGIPRRDLSTCELRASVSGFRSDTVSLTELTASGETVDVGSIAVHRTAKVKGMTLSAAPYQAPKEAKRAYEKGLQAERNGRFADARQHFEEAVKIYPKYTNAWFQLGGLLRKETDRQAARNAYARATAIDSKFLPAYLSLASMAFEEQNWPDVLLLTRHVLERDPLNYAKISGYVLDLDPLDYAEAYFYNAAANYSLNHLEQAEKSGLQAERLDVRPRFPQLHLLLAQIFAQRNNYASAKNELQTYLEMVPNGRNADLAREQLAQWEMQKPVVPGSAAIHQD